MRAFQKVVKRAVVRAISVVHVHRFYLLESNTTIVQGATTTMNLMVCDDDPDYDVGGDLTTGCECPVGSKIVSINLTLQMTQSAGESCEFLLFKNPDNGVAATPTLLFTNDVTPNNLVIRKNTLKYARVFWTTSGDRKTLKLFVKRKALMRIGRMRDNDRLQLISVASAAAGNVNASCYGTITTRR